MALDPFQTSDKSKFWSIFGTTAAVTYLAAAAGLLAIYRKGILDVFRLVAQKTARGKERLKIWWVDSRWQLHNWRSQGNLLDSRTPTLEVSPSVSISPSPPPKAKSLPSLRRMATSNSTSSNKVKQVQSAPPALESPV